MVDGIIGGPYQDCHIGAAFVAGAAAATPMLVTELRADDQLLLVLGENSTSGVCVNDTANITASDGSFVSTTDLSAANVILFWVRKNT